MSFFDSITEKDAALYYELDQAGNAHKTILYGAAHMAKTLYDILTAKGYTISFAVVDDAYVASNHVLTDIPVISASILDTYSETFNCIIAFGDSKTTDIDRIKHKCNKIFRYDLVQGTDTTDTINVPLSYYTKHKNVIEKFASKLADELSIKTLAAYINMRISGKYEYGQQYLDPTGYFCDFIPFAADEVYVDAGAFTGDTILAFLNCLAQRKLVYSGTIFGIEPIPDNFAKLQKAVSYDNCSLINKGLWDSEGEISFIEYSYASHIEESKESIYPPIGKKVTIETTTIDNIMKGEKVDYIKMDIEGAEYKALLGAKQTIEKHHPKLAVCLYHKRQDIVEIPELLFSFDVDYKYYLRWHRASLKELVLYAVKA